MQITTSSISMLEMHVLSIGMYIGHWHGHLNIFGKIFATVFGRIMRSRQPTGLGNNAVFILPCYLSIKEECGGKRNV